MAIADLRQPPAITGAEMEIEACERKIAELGENVSRAIAAVERGEVPPEGIPDGEAVAREIAHYYSKMGDLILARGDLDRAAVCYESALKLNPRQLSARMNLLKTKNFITEDDTTKAFLMGMLAEEPDNVGFLNQLGKIHYKLYERGQALDCFQRAVEIDPETADTLYWLAGLQQATGDSKAAEENYIRAVKIKPLIKVPAVKAVPDFSVLLIFAPFAGNTPTEYLLAKPPYEINISPLFPQVASDLNLLRSSGDIVINFVSDADQGRSVLPLVTTLVDQLGKPVINHPEKIQKTTREGIAMLLKNIPNCRLARVVRHAAGEAASAEALQKKIDFLLPLLARPAGTHGGDKFEKIDSFETLASFIQEEPTADHYLMEYIDYQSADGHFCKYRFIFVDGQILPYHLAIGDHWKVHHITTDMSKNLWMQAEEEAFLKNPTAVFSAKHYQALQSIQQAVGLEYFGIDCGLDKDDNLVIFEVNASMLVHQQNEGYPYKTPYVAKIKQAFDDMLGKLI